MSGPEIGDLEQDAQTDSDEGRKESTGGSESLEEDLSEKGYDNGAPAAEPVIEEDCTDFSDVAGLESKGIMRKLFRSEDTAYEFYKRFAKCHGFGIRKGDFCKDETGRVVRRRFFCNRAGLRDPKHYNRPDRRREHKPETRTNCATKLSINLDKDASLWRVRKVVMEHNHELTPPGMIHMMPSFRSMNDAAKAQIRGLHGHGVTTSKIFGYMVGQAGGYSFVGFSKKDAYNYVQRSKRECIVDGDSSVAIGYLEGKVSSDLMSAARYVLTEERMLANMLWCDGASRIDYQFFGDVLSFDSTYKKNKYRRPLVIFSGSNNHKQTCIFGFGLLMDETIASYSWLLENFVEAMCGRKPSVVVTDGDDAMKAAVKAVMPEATHRLCAWHMEKNITTNVKWDRLRACFRKWLYADMSIDEFEQEWRQAMVEYKTGERFWFRDTYEKRHMWANAYLRDKFCAGYRITSRCEGVNAYVKKFVKSRHCLLEMLHGLELMVMEYRNNELEAQFKSVHGFLVMTTGLAYLERHAATVYTREIFLDCKKEIEGVVNVNLVAKVRQMTTMIYTVEGYSESGRQVTVLFDRNSRNFRCDCGVWKKRGFPCRHMLFVMKQEHLKEIPERLVLRRWRKDPKSLQHYTKMKDDGSERAFLMRHGALNAASQRLVFVGAKSKEMFDVSVEGLVRLCEEVEGMGDVSNKASGSEQFPGKIKDPAVVKTKGAPRIQKKSKGQKRRCTNCKLPGHTNRHCSRKNATNGSVFVSPKSDDWEQSQCSSHSTAPEGVDRREPTAAFGATRSGSVTSPDSGPSDAFLEQMMVKIDDVSDQILATLKRM